MKRILIACVAVAAFAAPAFAQATYELKAGDGNYTGTNVDPAKNPVAYYSSDATGNGGTVGGNGSAWNGIGAPPPAVTGMSYDLTNAPGSRAANIQDALGLVGKGSNK